MGTQILDCILKSKDRAVIIVSLLVKLWKQLKETTDRFMDIVLDTFCLPLAVIWLLVKKVVCKCLRLPLTILRRWRRVLVILTAIYILIVNFPDIIRLQQWTPFPREADDHVSWNVDDDVTNVTTATSLVFAFTPCVSGDVRQTYTIMKTARLLTSNETTLVFYVLARWNELEMISHWFSGWSESSKTNVHLKLRNLNMHLDDNFPCNMVKLILPMIIPEGLIIYMDPNHIFLAPPSDLWKYFEHFDSTTFVASGSNGLVEKVDIGQVAELDLDWGIILMNLTRFRNSAYSSLVLSLISNLDFPAQVPPDLFLLHSALSLISAKAVVLPCKWTYSPQHCNSSHPVCDDVINSGANVIKGSDMAFVDPNAVPPFYAVQRVMLGAGTKVDMYHVLIPRIQDILLSGFLQNAGTPQETRIATFTHQCGRDIQTYTYHLEKYCRQALNCHKM